MASIPEEASATRSRIGFRDSTPSDSLLPIRSWSKKHNLVPPTVTCAVEDDDKCITSTPRFDFSGDPSFWKDHNVQVIIRIRPLNTSERSLYECRRCIRQENFQTVTWTGHTESRFTFDVVADESVTQENLFTFSGLPMVDNCIAGYNSCMFAYGQTGSGKTHTMLGDIEGGTQHSNVNCGMTPRVFEYLFLRMRREKEARRDENLIFSCKCSFLEIYNEQILDLLDPSSSNLQIREDINKGVHVESLKEIEVKTADDVIQQLLEGSANRKVAATNMNRASSRSHCVFTCTIESKWEVQGVKHHRYARLNLVDLAGSERQKSSGAEGDRFKEATNINKSLSTLGLVIMNLVSMSNKKSLHVPYRDSKLTFLLQDSLGGNAKTIIIANISPSSCCSLETLSTLKFAQRAKFIKNNAVVNEDSSGDVIAMKMQIQQLRKEVSQLRGLAGEEAYDHIINGNASYLDSSGSSHWEGLHGSFSSVVADNMSRRKMEYEVALLGAFKREKDKEAMLQVLTAENNAILKLAKQRENEIQAVKLRLRLREAGMKRLESVISREMPAERHFLEEKEEHLKEIELLRNQVDRNQEVTRFAMENLRLKEDLKELRSFLEEGGRDFMNEQIKVLQNKLIEALDWKFINQSDPSSVSDMPNGVHINGSQAVHNVIEMDMMQQKLNYCLRDKEKLERRIEELETEQGQNSSSRRSCAEKTQQTADEDKVELGSVVDAIAAVSKKQTESHEAAIIFLSKENDELREKLRVLIEDNNKLIELCEKAISDDSNSSRQGGNIELKERVESVEKKLEEMHEENERLMGLYEVAMQERDQFKRLQLDRTETINLVKAISILTEIQKSGVEFNELSDEIDNVRNDMGYKGKEYEYLKECYLAISGQMSVCSRKLSALKCCVSKSMSSLDYFEKRDAQGKEKRVVAMLHSNKKREALSRLHIEKGEIEKVLMDADKAEAEHRNSISRTMSKLDAENKRWKTEMIGSASEMLEWEEEKARLGAIMRKERDGFGKRIKEIEDGRRKVGRMEREIHELEAEMENGLRVVEEMEGVNREKAMVLDFIMAGNEEMSKAVGELVHLLVEAVFREGEIIIVEEEVREMADKLEVLKIRQERTKLNHCSLLNTDRIIEDLKSIDNYVINSPPTKITSN